MIRIAVLGDIGSGKSYVARQFGYPVFSADEEVNKLYRNDRMCYSELKKILPKYIISFPIKKIELSKAIVAEQHNLKKIIKIVHPKVRFRMNNFIKKNKNKKFIILDIPLLMENKIDKKDLLSAYYSPVNRYFDDHEMVPEIRELASGSFKVKNPPEIKGGGYVVQSLEAALWAFYNSDCYEEGVLKVVNLGDDADTTGAVYGQLAGAYYGIDSIPKRFKDNITMKELILSYAGKLYQNRKQG